MYSMETQPLMASTLRTRIKRINMRKKMYSRKPGKGARGRIKQGSICPWGVGLSKGIRQVLRQACPALMHSFCNELFLLFLIFVASFFPRQMCCFKCGRFTLQPRLRLCMLYVALKSGCVQWDPAFLSLQVWGEKRTRKRGNQ